LLTGLLKTVPSLFFGVVFFPNEKLPSIGDAPRLYLGDDFALPP